MDNAISNQLKIKEIRSNLLSGKISYEDAKKQAMPIIDDIYEQSKVIAKKYNRKPSKLSFAALMR